MAQDVQGEDPGRGGLGSAGCVQGEDPTEGAQAVQDMQGNEAAGGKRRTEKPPCCS